jgi:hypothetical protein
MGNLNSKKKLAPKMEPISGYCESCQKSLDNLNCMLYNSNNEFYWDNLCLYCRSVEGLIHVD